MNNWRPEQIEAFRKKLGLSQRVFGELLGVSRIHIYYLERGEREPSKTLMLLLDCIKNNQRKGAPQK